MNAEHDAQDAPDDEAVETAAEQHPARGKRRGEDRMRRPGENTAHQPQEDRSCS